MKENPGVDIGKEVVEKVLKFRVVVRSAVDVETEVVSVGMVCFSDHL